MNKIEQYIVECGQHLEQKVAFNTVTIHISGNEASMDEEAKDKCISALESKLGPSCYQDCDNSSILRRYAYSTSLIFNSGKEMFIAVNDFRESIKCLFDGQYDIEIELSNTGEHENI
ncbi:MAG: hypothetical protein JXR88_14600 [Clostridia bacterium]|nr:hypothetical protein [Clostridia bacterium]